MTGISQAGSIGPEARGLRDVLVVEDDESIRETLAALLEHAGYAAKTATDGLEALQLVEERQPDLIVLDMMLPRLSGWQFLEQVRSLGEHRQRPVLVHSALDAPGEVETPVGVSTWLTKPVEADNFLRTVKALIGPPLPRVLVVDDERTIRELLVEHLEDEGFVADSAANLSQAYGVLRTQRPDAMVLDLMLPGQSGWDFLRSRQDDAALAEIPVVVLSAAPQARLELARQLGADALLGKPFDLNQVTAMLHRFVRR